MFFFLAFIMVLAGIIVASLTTFMPANMILSMPSGFGALFFIIGMILSMVGLFLLYGRARKVGADVLIAPARVDKIVWLFIHKDNIIEPIMVDRHDESTNINKRTNSIIYDLKAYRIGDHSARLVLDSVGHTIDARMAIYASYLKKIKKLPNLQLLRHKAKDDGELHE